MNIILSYYTMLQVCSDVHLERGDITKHDFPTIIQPCAEILALAGDIGDPFSTIFEEFIHYCSQRFQYVLFVSGNHEYYQHDIPDDTSMYALLSYQDFIQINDFNHQKSSKLHRHNVDFIRENVSKQPCIVITHHAPSYTCISDEYFGNKLNCCFASHLDDLLKHPNVLGWTYGHTHHNILRFETKGSEADGNNHFLYANCYRTDNYNSSGAPLLL